MSVLKCKEMLLLAFFLVVFSSTSLSYWLLDYSWLEQQRITQLLLVLFASLVVVSGYFRSSSPVISPSRALLLALVLGLVSALLSQYPDWALKEWAKYASSVALIFYLGHILRQASAQQLVLFMLLVTSIILAVQFYAFYLASFLPVRVTLTPI